MTDRGVRDDRGADAVAKRIGERVVARAGAALFRDRVLARGASEQRDRLHRDGAQRGDELGPVCFVAPALLLRPEAELKPRRPAVTEHDDVSPARSVGDCVDDGARAALEGSLAVRHGERLRVVGLGVAAVAQRRFVCSDIPMLGISAGKGDEAFEHCYAVFVTEHGFAEP